MLIVKNKPHHFSAYTLIETLIVLTLTLFFFLFPIIAFTSWKNDLSAYQFFIQFERRIYAVQKSAIVHQKNTSFSYVQEKNYLLFQAPSYSSMMWQVLPIPDGITVEQDGIITFKAETGNESSLKKYTFYWTRKKQRISYQFQMGSGRYLKKIE
ncbi:hypothetical protein A5844_002200 [Enterococcus sp. 10A9_DIV0425]|uniref:Prepilin-type N-terminal cleavage/methylation domain-containing protein n=2 Tax=Candidatus Enterococcus wittei TaxID=1987383 RepID=A0A242JZ54_9ENTE|nr:hypothetical protein A5844_002200 [Enterococcus sp. 10A9_DIV0425]